MDLTNQRVLIFLKNGFNSRGVVEEHTDQFIIIHDEVSNKRRMIAIDAINEIQNLEDNE